MTEPVNILCLKWGKRYSPDYVNRLYNSVKRNLTIPFLFHCCTEDAEDVDENVRIIPFPADPDLPGRGWPDILVKLMETAGGFGDRLASEMKLTDSLRTMSCFVDPSGETYPTGSIPAVHGVDFWLYFQRASEYAERNISTCRSIAL